jgi:hypothetical protein
VALRSRGESIQHLLLQTYRTSTIHAGMLREGLQKMTIKRETVIVLQTFDSGLYMVAPEEGGLIPPSKRSDGSYHIDGELVLITKDLQYAFLKQLVK